MKYWHMQLHPGGTSPFPEQIRKILKETSFIGLGDWKEGEPQIKQFKTILKIGDIVAVRIGQTPIALVEVIGEAEYTGSPNENLDWFENRRKIKILDFYQKEDTFRILKAQGTISVCKNLKVETSKVIINWHNKILKKNNMKTSIDLLKYKYQIILQGPPGTGKTRLAKLMAEELTKTGGEFEIIQFHPAYSYEDFVRGIVAETTASGSVSYKVTNKILAEFAQKAKDNANDNYVLIIDEINRANLPAVLGELIYALEYRDEEVTSMYEYQGKREISLPDNLYIIGTMNTADRSVGHIDYAIKRRFAFVDVLPDESAIANEKAKVLFKKVQNLFSTDFLSPDFKVKDVILGHSYFLAKDENELKMKLDFEIKPILWEYLKDGIFLDVANKEIENLNV